jgi:zinc protease
MKHLLFTLLLLPVLACAAAGDVRLTLLDNGLTLYTKEDHSKPLIALYAMVDGGSRTETPDIAGLSHFYEHLVARGGSTKQKQTEFRRQMSSLGEEQIYTYDDGTLYAFTVPTENFVEALWRYSDFLMELKPDSASIVKERTIVMEEYNMSVADNPQGRLQENLMKAAFTLHPYFPTTIGTPEVIQNATYDQLRTFYEERYVPNQIVMAIVGDFQSDRIIADIKAAFGKYKPGRSSFEQDLVEPPQREFRQISDSMQVSSSYALVAYHIPPLSHPDMPALKVLAQILGGGSNSRLDQVLKLEENLVLYNYCYPDFLRDASLLYVGLQCETSREEKAIRKTFSVIQKLAQEGVTAQELVAAKEKLIADEIQANATFKGQAQNMVHYHVARAFPLLAQMPAMIRSVTAEDVQRVAKKYLDVSQATLSLIEPKGAALTDYASHVKPYTVREQVAPTNASQIETRYVKLDNGLTLILREDHSAPTVCVSAYVKGGQWLEPKGSAGLGYLTASMLDKGTEKYQRDNLQARKDELGVDFWNSASEDYLQAGFSGLADKLDGSLDLLDQLLFHATFPVEEVEKARTDQIQGIKSIPDQPWEYTHAEIQKDLYRNSPYRNPVIGIEAEVNQLNRKDVLGHYQKVFVPGNVIVAAVGDFDATELAKRLKALWGDVPKGKVPKIELVKDQPVKKTHCRQVASPKDQNTFNISYLTVGAGDGDFLPLVLAKRMLNTRLFYKWIYDKGIAYRMWTRMFPRLGQTRFYFEMGVSDRNFTTAREGILNDLRDYLAAPLSAEELELARLDEITRHRMSWQTNQGIADGLGSWEALGQGYQFFEKFPEKIAKVSAQDVYNVAHKYLSPADYIMVNVGPTKVE